MLPACRSLRASVFAHQYLRLPASTRSLSSGEHAFQPEINAAGASLNNVTVVNSAADAAHAVKTLLSLGPEKCVAWGTQPTNSSQNNVPYLFTMSAYAGEDIDFGKGPHLFVARDEDPDHANRIWRVFARYFEDEQCPKVWLDYDSSLAGLNMINVQPRGLVAELVNMSKLVSMQTEGRALREYADEFLKRSQVRLARSVLVDNGFPEEDMSRPWEGKAELDHSVWDDSKWIAMACADARLIHSLFEALRLKLKAAEVHGVNATEDFSSEFTNLYEVYRYFFVPLVGYMHDVEKRGVGLKQSSIHMARSLHDDRVRALKDNFLKWASTFCPDASLMDLNSSAQLKQLLFAPCKNERSKRNQWPEEKQFKVLPREDSCDETAKGGKQKRRQKISINIRGRGATAKKHSASGWPSMTVQALRQAAGFPRGSPPTFGQEDEEFCYAVDDLLAAKELESKGVPHLNSIENIIDVDDRCRIPYFIHDKTGLLCCSAEEGSAKFLAKEMCSDEGRSLLVGEFMDLRLSLLAQMSESNSLRERIEAKANTQELGAYHLFKDVKSGVDTGQCGFSSTEVKCEKTVADEFPVEYHQTGVLDENIADGGNVKNLGKELRLKGGSGKKLQQRWFEQHPEVKEWFEKSVRFGETNGFVETMLGRRKVCNKLLAKNATVRNNSRSSAIRYILSGSAGEAVMGALRKLSCDETLMALGWDVVFVDGARIVLEGPSYGSEEVGPIVWRKMSAPMDFELDVLLDVGVSVGGRLIKG